MKMIRRTKHTSTNGVTLISEFMLAFDSLPTELCHRFFIAARFLQEVDRHLRSGVRHLDSEAVDAILEVVVGPHRRDGHAETEGGGDEGFRDTGRNRRDTAARG